MNLNLMQSDNWNGFSWLSGFSKFLTNNANSILLIIVACGIGYIAYKYFYK